MCLSRETRKRLKNEVCVCATDESVSQGKVFEWSSVCVLCVREASPCVCVPLCGHSDTVESVHQPQSK